MLLVNEFLPISKYVSRVRADRADGIDPLRQLSLILRNIRSVNFTNDDGIDPTRLLDPNDSEVNEHSLLRLEGIDPVKLFLLKFK